MPLHSPCHGQTVVSGHLAHPIHEAGWDERKPASLAHQMPPLVSSLCWHNPPGSRIHSLLSVPLLFSSSEALQDRVPAALHLHLSLATSHLLFRSDSY